MDIIFRNGFVAIKHRRGGGEKKVWVGHWTVVYNRPGTQ